MGHLLISKIYGYCIYALAVFTKKIKPNPNTFVFDLGFDWRKEWDSLRDIQIITCFKFHSILTLIFCHNVAITPGLQTTVSSVVWSACFCCCLLYRLQADFQPVRIPFHQRQNKTNRQIFACSFCLAEAKGFEPLRLLGKRFSRPPRYDHFDKLPFI